MGYLNSAQLLVRMRTQGCNGTPAVRLTNIKTYLLNINLLMFRVGEISSLIFLSQNVAQLSVNQKLDRIR